MTATYALNNSAQSGASVQRVAFPKGKMFGHLRAVRAAQFREPKVRCLCTSTGTEIEMSPGRLYIHASGGSKTCPRCNTRQKVWREHNPKKRGKFCMKCYGISNNRPLTGRCVCGERYAPEVIAIDLDNRNPGNLAIVSESRRRIEAPCNP